MTRLAALAAVVVVTVLISVTTGYVLFGRDEGERFAQCREGQVAGGAGAIGGPFTLVGADGGTATDGDVITEPTLVYFGYTFCPDVCPIDSARNAQAVDLLAEEGISATPVFITIDPKRDTPQVVGDFAANFHERMVGLTGSEAQVRAASQAYRTYYQAHDDGSDPYYLVDHSTFTYLALPEEGVVEYFRREDSAQDIARRTACFARAS